MIPLARPAWHLQAACRDHPADWWHADENTVEPAPSHRTLGTRIRQQTERAQRICRTCPVIAHCLLHALDHPERGVWGGTTERERATMLLLRGPTARKRCHHGHDLGQHGVVYLVNGCPQINCRACQRDRRAKHRADQS